MDMFVTEPFTVPQHRSDMWEQIPLYRDIKTVDHCSTQARDTGTTRTIFINMHAMVFQITKIKLGISDFAVKSDVWESLYSKATQRNDCFRLKITKNMSSVDRFSTMCKDQGLSTAGPWSGFRPSKIFQRTEFKKRKKKNPVVEFSEFSKETRKQFHFCSRSSLVAYPITCIYSKLFS